MTTARTDALQIWLGPRWTAMFSQRSLMRGRPAIWMSTASGPRCTMRKRSPMWPPSARPQVSPPRSSCAPAARQGRRCSLVHCTAPPPGRRGPARRGRGQRILLPRFHHETAMGLNRAWDMLRAGVNGPPSAAPPPPPVTTIRTCSCPCVSGCLLQKHEQRDPHRPQCGVGAIEMCTIGAARAIGLDREIRSLEPGKRAHSSQFSLRQPRLCPLQPHPAPSFTAPRGMRSRPWWWTVKPWCGSTPCCPWTPGAGAGGRPPHRGGDAAEAGHLPADLTRWPLCE